MVHRRLLALAGQLRGALVTGLLALFAVVVVMRGVLVWLREVVSPGCRTGC